MPSLQKVLKLYYIDLITKKYSDFEGRATRGEFWFFLFFNCLIFAALSFISLFLDYPGADLILGFLFGIFILVPHLSVSVRRLHDAGFSGYWLLINLVPIGWLVLLVLALLDSQPGDNKYGPNPKQVLSQVFE